MKIRFLSSLLCLVSSMAIAHQTEVTFNRKSYHTLVGMDEINGIHVFATDTFNQVVQKTIAGKNISVPDEQQYSRIYFTNKGKDKYLKIWGGPDLGYGWFYTIGYTRQVY